jgi:transposase
MIALPPGARVWLACGVTDMRRGMPGLALMVQEALGRDLRLKFQVQHPEPAGHRMLRWTDEASTSAARNVA